MLILEQKDEFPLDTLELIIKETLVDYLDTITFKKMDSNEDAQFGEIDKIKKIFQSCYLEKDNTNLLMGAFEKLKLDLIKSYFCILFLLFKKKIIFFNYE